MYLEFRNFAVEFDGNGGRFSCFRAEDPGRLIPFLRDFRLGGGWRLAVSPETPPVEFRELTAEKADGASLVFRLLPDRLELVNTGARPVRLRGPVIHGGDAARATFAVSDRPGAAMLRNSSGPAVAPDAAMLYDRITDSGLCFDRPAAETGLAFDWETAEYRIDFMLTGRCSFSFREGVCASLFHLRHWKAVSDKHGFASPPVGWMTWYAVRFDACEEVVLHNARRMRELFGDIAGPMILWVDWEYCHRDLSGMGQPDADALRPRPEVYPHGLRWLARRLKRLGFTPALWCGATNDGTLNELLRRHPDWLLGEVRDWCGRYWVDCSHPGVISEYFPTVFRQILDWGFEAVKFDCWGRALTHADEFRAKRFDPGLSSEGAMRRVLDSVRKVLGEERYFLGCLILDRPLQTANDFFDAARVGDDVFTWAEFRANAVGRLLSYYPMHNTAWHLDPDTLVLREEYSTVEQARTRVSFVALTGTLFTVGDPVDALDAPRV